jgi:hypothetical protein
VTVAAVGGILGFDPAVFLKAAFEVSLLSLFGVCLVHSILTHGWNRTSREFVAGFFLTAFCESIGVLSGAYVYPGYHVYVFATPLANPASWIATVYILIEITNRLVYGKTSIANAGAGGRRAAGSVPRLFRGGFWKTLCLLAAIDAVLALVVDLVMDPLASIYNWWIWVPCLPDVTTVGLGVVKPYNFVLHTFMTTPRTFIADFFAGFFPGGMRYPTRVLGIPLINFFAWFVFVFVFTFEFRAVECKERWSEFKKTLVLWAVVVLDVPVLAFALIAPNI